jgi:hypothetical protein
MINHFLMMRIIPDLLEITSRWGAKASQLVGNPLLVGQPEGKVRQDKST